MKVSARILFVVTALAVAIPFLPQKTYAGDLGTLVKLDRLAVNKTTGGTICATAETTATENTLQVIFPTGVSVNSNASNWTVTTTSLPTGSTPMPGIVTAQSVSGQTVTFPISDLTTSTQYCFHFASGTITTPSSTGTFVGTLRTRDVTNATIDTHEFALSIVTNDSISVTATVPANPTDFSSFLSLLNPPNGTYPQDTEFTYSLNYSSTLLYPSSIVVEAQWDLGTIVGSGSPTENILTYVIGSATNGYNSTPPVIDTVNRKISWTFNSFPASLTNQAVQFKLKTTNSYTGPTRVEFTVNGRVIGPGTQTADSSITSSYRYQDPLLITPSPTPTTDPSRIPTTRPGTPTITPSPTPIPTTNIIKAIDIRTISSTNAAIFTETASKSTIKIRYGTAQNNLNQIVSGNELSPSHLLTLTGLQANTRYFFKITATTESNVSTTSDFYQFDTAIASEPPKANISSLIITSGDVVLTDPLRSSSTFPHIVIPKGISYGFKFSVEGFEKVKAIKAIIRNNKVLGLASFQAYANTESLTITEIQPGQYIGRLNTSVQPGVYKLILQIQDFNGNIVEQEVSTLQVVNPLRVINAFTKQGIEGAKVTLSLFNSRLKTFELISSVVTPIKNPSLSEADGSVWIVLPEGKYRADIEVLGYEKKTIDFSINPTTQANYPEISLKQLPFNPATYTAYTISTFMDLGNLIKTYIHTLHTSIRFFDLIAFVISSILTFLTVLATARRLSIPVPLLPYYLLFCLKSLVRRNKNEFLVHGSLTDKVVGEIVIGATVLAIKNGKILAQSKTNPQGEFLLHLYEATDIKLTASHKEFKTATITIKKNDLQNRLKVEIEPSQRTQHLGHDILWYANFIYDSFFEALLILSLVSELLFVLEFGWLKVMPFIIISLLNIVLWAFHVKHSRSIEY